MGQAAYDYNTARRRKVPQTQRKTALRVEKGGKRRRRCRQRCAMPCIWWRQPCSPGLPSAC